MRSRISKKLCIPSEFRKHMYAAHREMLLAARSILDAAIEHIEKPAIKEKQVVQEKRKAADDLTAIRGIGATVEARLNEAGVITYAQLASLTPQQVAEITGGSAKRIAKEEWISQARALAEEAKTANPLSTWLS